MEGFCIMEKISLQFRDKQVQCVLQRDETKFIQLSLAPHKGLTKHRTPHNLAVLVLTGKVLFTIEEQSFVLEASEMLAVDPGVEHAIEGIEQSTVLLVLTPDFKLSESAPVLPRTQTSEHENAYRHPELIEHIAPELRPLVDDHIALCKVLEATASVPHEREIRSALEMIQTELQTHFVAEEQVVFPRIAAHVGGQDVGPVARLLAEHAHIRRLYAEARELLKTWEETGDAHIHELVADKIQQLSASLLNHLGKEDSHLFPMASRLLSQEEKAAVANELQEYTHKMP